MSANECATLFASRCTINTECRPEAMHWKSAYKCPKRDRLGRDPAMDFMTDSLSPSIISFEEPESIANSNTLQQARTSVSSLSTTYGPLADSDAMTSPKLFRITTPTLDALMSLKTATSKLSLK